MAEETTSVCCLKQYEFSVIFAVFILRRFASCVIGANIVVFNRNTNVIVDVMLDVVH